jgi:hypothetical protein
MRAGRKRRKKIEQQIAKEIENLSPRREGAKKMDGTVASQT